MDFSEEVSDETLVESFQGGDRGAFEALLRRYEGRLFAFLCRQTGDVQEAQDLFQETWIRVYRSAGRFEGGRRFSPWVYQIAYRLSIDSHRRRARDERATFESGQERFSPDIQNVAEERTLRARVRDLVEALAEELRTVVILRHYQGLGYDEIAEIVGCPVGTGKSRMHRAMDALKERAERAGLLGGWKNDEM